MLSKLWWRVFRLPPAKVFIICTISAAVMVMAHLVQKEDPVCPELKARFIEDRYTVVSHASASVSNKHRFHEDVAAFYEQNNYELVWVSSDGTIIPYARVMIRTLDSSWQEGLEPFNYHITEIKSLCNDVDHEGSDVVTNDCIELDIRLTDAFFTYTSDLYAGRINDEHWNHDRKKHLNEITPPDSLRSIANGKSISDVLSSFSCPHEPYKQLRRLLRSYCQDNDTINQETIFQKKQIASNMERWRWLPRNMPVKYIMANTASFDLHVSDHKKDTLTMKIIAGKLQQPTPLLSSSIQYLIINPWWEIPHSIATKEMLPLIKNNISYLTDHHIKVYRVSGTHLFEINITSIDWNGLSEKNFPYRLRQMPGTWNALGTIKFIFPNRQQVYFHDTPNPELFQKTERTFSHGCMRIEKPVLLAAYLLGQTEESIKRKISTDKEQLLKVIPMPVFICYWTVWTDTNGKTSFAQDVYGYDLKLQQLLYKSVKQAQDSFTTHSLIQ